MLSFEEVIVNEIMGDPGERLRRLVFRGSIAGKARPGQFVHIQVSPHLEPFLRRPLSLAVIEREKGEITVLYRVQGRGTEILAGARPGEKLSVLGPLGTGFTLPDSGELWLVAGGIGSFPLFALAQAALASGLPVRLFWGGSNRSFLESAGLSDWRNLLIEMNLTTLDGSLGQDGLVTDLLREKLTKHFAGGHNEEDSTKPFGEIIKVAACGPRGMMQAVVEQCGDLGVPVEVSLEEHMGCGVGACLGCAATLRDAQGRPDRKKVCQDGPVFRGEEVVWDAAD